MTTTHDLCESRAVTKWSEPIRRAEPHPPRFGHAGTGAQRAVPPGWEIFDEGTHHRRCPARRGPRGCRGDIATGATKRSTASITVWLQVDAQSGWPAVVAAANAAFAKQHPGVDVNVQYQTWGTHLGKFDATLAGGNTPDVIEMGNTEMTKYMAAGAFQDITSAKSSFDNSCTWLEGLAASGRYNGKLYGVPYYAGSRVVTYRTDQFKQAGIKSTPTSLAEFTADAGKLNKKFGKKGYSPVYIAGTDWYVAMGFVYDFGGKIATQVSGKWKGTLDSPQSIAGLTAYKNFFLAASKASKTTDESRPTPYSVYADGHAGSMRRPRLVLVLRRRQVQDRDRSSS